MSKTELVKLRGDGCALAQGSHGRAGCGECIACARHEATAALALLRRIVTYATEDRATTPGYTRLARALEEARQLLRMPVSNAAPGIASTIFECRTCGNYTWGKTDGSCDQPGWARIAGIDGPNAICPECRADPTALDALKADGYENARIADEVGA